MATKELIFSSILNCLHCFSFEIVNHGTKVMSTKIINVAKAKISKIFWSNFLSQFSIVDKILEFVSGFDFSWHFVELIPFSSEMVQGASN